MNMFEPITAATPAAYIKAIADPERRADITALDKRIRKEFPTLKPHLQGGMLGYGSYHYKSKSGREGDWPPIGLANRAQYIAVYACGVTTDGKYVAELAKKRMPKADVGKSCIRFKKLSDMDLDVLMDVLRESAKGLGCI
jgi:hypothetical protein